MTMNIVTHISLSPSLRCTSIARVLAQPVSSFWSLLRTHYSSRMPEPIAGNGNAHQPRTIRRLVDALIFYYYYYYLFRIYFLFIFLGGAFFFWGGGLAFIFYCLNQLKSAKHLSSALFRPEMTLCVVHRKLKHILLTSSVQFSSTQYLCARKNT